MITYEMDGWIVIKDIKTGAHMLVRESKTSPGMPEAFSLNGKDALFRPTPDAAKKDWESATKTKQPIVPLVCGTAHRKHYAVTGFEDPQHWCNTAKTAIKKPPAPVSAAPVSLGIRAPAEGGYVLNTQTIPARGKAKDFTVTIGSDATRCPVPHGDEQFPDGVAVAVPPVTPEQGGKFILVLPEQQNEWCLAPDPFFEKRDPKGWTVIESLGCHKKPYPYPNADHSGAFWLFSMHPSPLKKGRWVGMAHSEDHKMAVAPACWKALHVTYSDDLGKTWTNPKPIITCPKWEAGKYENVWGGSGDPCFVYSEREKVWRAYLYASGAQYQALIAQSSDPEARAGTWKLLHNNGFTADALNPPTSGFKSMDIRSGNPQVIWHQGLGCWILLTSEWADPENLTVAMSDDGINWRNKKKVHLHKKGNLPLYPSCASAKGGTYFIGEDGKARLYTCDSTNGRRMMVRSLTIAPVF